MHPPRPARPLPVALFGRSTPVAAGGFLAPSRPPPSLSSRPRRWQRRCRRHRRRRSRHRRRGGLGRRRLPLAHQSRRQQQHRRQYRPWLPERERRHARGPEMSTAQRDPRRGVGERARAQVTGLPMHPSGRSTPARGFGRRETQGDRRLGRRHQQGRASWGVVGGPAPAVATAAAVCCRDCRRSRRHSRCRHRPRREAQSVARQRLPAAVVPVSCRLRSSQPAGVSSPPLLPLWTSSQLARWSSPPPMPRRTSSPPARRSSPPPMQRPTSPPPTAPS